MGKNRFKRSFARLTALMLAVLVSVLTLSSVAMADEMTAAAAQEETSVQVLAETAETATEELSFTVEAEAGETETGTVTENKDTEEVTAEVSEPETAGKEAGTVAETEKAITEETATETEAIKETGSEAETEAATVEEAVTVEETAEDLVMMSSAALMASSTEWPTQTSNSFAGITLNTSIEWSGMDAWWPDSNGLISRTAAWTAVGEVSSISKLKAGDVIVWAEGSTAYWVNHIAIVTEVASDGSYFVTADGNDATTTGLSINKRTDFYKRNSTYGKVLVWRNTVNGAAIAKYVDQFTREMISANDTSMAVQWSSINWCYCFVVTALLESEPVEEYGSLKVTKTTSLPDGTLKISKTTSGSDSDKDAEFTFTLNVTNASGSVVSTAFSYTKSDGTTGTIKGNGGTLKLKNGQNAVISGIPQGYGYKVSETADSKYSTKVSKNGGTASSGNTVSGTMPAGSTTQAFTFTVNIKNGSSNVSGLTVASGLTTNSSGNVSFTLTPGTSGSASKTLSGIPAGYTYTVTETAVSGWTASKTKATGTITANSTKSESFRNTYTPSQQSAAFTNTRKTTDMEIIKTSAATGTCSSQLKGNAMYSQDFSGAKFSVQIYDAITKNWGTAATYTTGSDGTVKVTGLCVGDKVKVTETKAPAGYLLPEETSQTVTLAESGNTVTFKDEPTFDPGTPVVKKVKYENGVMVSDYAVAGAVFRSEYFDNDSCTGTAVRTWYFVTGSDGTFTYSKKCLAPGYTSDALYVDMNNIPELPLGSVKYTEIESPKGYKICETPVMGKITQNSTTGLAQFSWITKEQGQITVESDGTVTIGDDEIVIVVDKIDSGTGEALAGAQLQILDGKDVVYEWTTDGKAREIKEILQQGKTYTLHEAKAPEGYKKAADIQFRTDEKGNITVLSEYVDTYTTDKNYLAVKMEDVKMIALPVTGSSDNLIIVIFGSALTVCGAGCAVLMARRKKHQEVM